MVDQLVRDMVRHASAERAVVELFVAIDRRDWTRVRRTLADVVDVDLGSIHGGGTGTMDADALVAAWRAGLEPLEAVHHQVGNLRSHIHEDDAHVACYGIAYHHRTHPTGRDVRVLVGTYDVALKDSPRGWHVTAFRFRLRIMDGNPDLT